MAWALLERNVYSLAAVFEFESWLADEQMSEVLYRHLPFEGHAATARRIGAYASPWHCKIVAAIGRLGVTQMLRIDVTHRSTRLNR